MGLSKSQYKRYYACPRMLWLDTHEPGEAEEAPGAEGRKEQGRLVGETAKGLFGPYEDVTTLKEDGSLDIGAMLERTEGCLSRGVANICEAAFSCEGLYCAVDVLHRTEEGTYEIYEVKSGTSVRDDHVLDAAFQKCVLEGCGLTVAGVYVVTVDPSYVRRGEIDPRGLLRANDVGGLVGPFMEEIPYEAPRAEEVKSSPTEPGTPFHDMCKGCPYFSHCARGLPSPNVFDLYRMPFSDACGLCENGVSSFAEVREAGVPLSDKQARQVEYALEEKGTYVDRAGVRKFLSTLWYPMYFLDFETFQSAVPLFDGERPYEQEVFQYSLHYMEKEGGELRHTEFLARADGDPRREAAERMLADVPAGACVVAYNASFERGRIREMADLFPDLTLRLLKVSDSVRDLLDVFRGGYVYNRAMGGSFSIKSVLPALFPDDPAMDYHSLDEVHNGGEATDAFLTLCSGTLSEAEAERLRGNMLRYCGLDTYAMVKIWERLREYAGE